MTFDAHANLASGVVSVAPTTPTAGVTMTVVPDAGVTVPTAPFTAVVFPAATAPSHANAEIVRVSINASGAWTMTRAQEGTTARTILVGDAVYIGGVTAKTLTDIESAITAAAAGAQPVDSDLTAIAALAPTNDDVIQRKAGAWTNRTLAQLLADLSLGSLFQPLDSDLTAIAALATTTFGRSVLTAADATALRTLAGLGTAATQATSAFDASGAAAAAQAASQPLDSDLTAIAALTTTTFGRALLALADASGLRTAAGLVIGTDVASVTALGAEATARGNADALLAKGLLPTPLKTGAYTAAVNEFVPVDATSGGITVTLPTAPADGTRVAVKKIDASTNLVTISRGGSTDVFNKTGGSTSVSLTLTNQSVQFQYQATTGIWYGVGSDLGISGLDARYAPGAVTIAAAGASQTLTAPTSGTPEVVYDVTGSASSCALTLAGGVVGKLSTITVYLRQDATAGRAFTLPLSVAWAGQALPSMNLSAGKYDLVQFASTDGFVTATGLMIASAVQPFAVPSAPVSLSIQAASTQNILTWSDTSNGGSPITTHKVYRGTASGGETLLGAGSSPYTDATLTNGTQLYYKVAAVNAVGDGTQSAETGASPDHYLNIPAASGASTPYQAGIANGTQSIDLRVLISHATWTFSGNNFLLTSSSATATNGIAILYIDSTAKLHGAWFSGSGSQQDCSSSVALPFIANDTKWVRALMNPGAGTCDFFYSIDGLTWTTLGTQVAGKTTTAVQTPGAGVIVTVGQRSDAAAQFTGKIWKARWIRNSLPILTMDFSAQSGPGPWTATTGETWTAIGTAAIV